MKKNIILLTIIFITSIQVSAKVVSKPIEYRDGDAVLQGWLFYDDEVKNPKPGVIVVHEWWGLDDYAKNRAKQIAELGYVAFASDIYGKGVLKTTFEEAAEISGKYRNDINLLRSRINAALTTFKQQPEVDKEKIAAIGYCFGGTTVLELARSGAELKGVVSFHGGLQTSNLDDAKNIKTKVLICHGAKDPFVSTGQFNGFVTSMNKAGVDYQLIIYSNAVHGFTNPHNGTDASSGLAYNESADKRSWEAMEQFFVEIFK